MDVGLMDAPDGWDEEMQQENTSGVLKSVAEQVLQDDEIGEYIELSLFVYVGALFRLSSYTMLQSIDYRSRKSMQFARR